MRAGRSVVMACLMAVVGVPDVRADSTREIQISDLDLSAIHQGWGNVHKNRSVVGLSLKIAGRDFDGGIGTHANSEISLDLKQKATHFTARVGLDDDSKDPKNESNPAVRFVVIGDGKIIWQKVQS
jgi:alpha-galactosidase